MQPSWRRSPFCMVAFAALCTADLARGQLVITEIMHSPGGVDALWEWVEVLNVSGAPLDLDGWVFDDDDESTVSMANISSAGGTRPTIVPAGGVAVLYPGDELGFMAERFNDAWGGGITLVGVDGLTSLAPTDAVGLWSNHASYAADAIPGSTISPRRTFASAVAAIDYSSGFPEPEGGGSIAWNGSGAVTSGANWIASQHGALGAFTSVETTIEGAQINSTEDRGNPGALPSGPPAAGLLITEIMFAPASPLVSVGFSESDFEWVEVLNNTDGPIDFAQQAGVFDDDDGSKLTTPNIHSGALAEGEIGILFNSARITVADMRAMWGDAQNYIPVTQWPSLNNTGGDTIAIWENFVAYNTEPANGSGHDQAMAAVSYGTAASEDWPTVNNESSIWLNNLSGDPNLGENWTRAGAAGDMLSGQASPIHQTAVDHPGGDIGSPGYAPGVPPAGLTGDYNNDGKVDAADYVAWRKTGAGGQQGYSDWRANFGGMAGAGGSVSNFQAVPEPASLALLLTGFAALCTRRQAAYVGR